MLLYFLNIHSLNTLLFVPNLGIHKNKCLVWETDLFAIKIYKICKFIS